ncbi:MAG: DUF3536 domain-containing protein [Elusimicrobiota bacterium]
MSSTRCVCIHGHFYQPPRENPWLSEIEVQDSARPYHDWNERIAEECYRSNAHARVLDGQGRIAELVDNYSRISFDFGPTLLSWLERRRPETYRAVLEADRLSRRRFGGHGSAMAQAYSHMILPLASVRDQRTQVLWGLRDFERRFGRRAEGMWLPETAVDVQTLEALADGGVRFTVLAPRQALRVRRFGDTQWKECSGGVDPTRPYRVRLPSGRAVAVFFYDGPISLGIAFERLLSDGEAFVGRIRSAFSDACDRPQLVTVSTDGESYGHHHRFGEMALAYALRSFEQKEGVRLTNFAQYLALNPPVWEAEIVEKSAWSCSHGVERWRSDCGCNCGAGPGWKQSWRGPLRDAFDRLRDACAPLYEERAGRLLRDPWEARDAYIDLLLDPSTRAREDFFSRQALRPLSQAERCEVLRLLELQRHLMLMYTSCGWFFDEVSGLETVQVMRYAARAAELAEELFGRPFHEVLAERLSLAPSNIAEYGDGRRVYERFARSAAVSPAALCEQYALTGLFEDPGERSRAWGMEFEREDFRRAQAGGSRLVVGRVRMRSQATLEERRFLFGALHLGGHSFHGGVRPDAGSEDFRGFESELLSFFDGGDLSACLRSLSGRFGEAGYDLSRLFLDEQRRILDRVVEAAVSEASAAYRHVYERNAPLLRFLRGRGVCAPKGVQSAAEMALNAGLRALLEAEEPDLPRLLALLDEAERSGVRLESETAAARFSRLLVRRAARLERAAEDPAAWEALLEPLRLLARLPFSVDVWETQNSVFGILHGACGEARLRARGVFSDEDSAWRARRQEAANLLNIRLEPLPSSSHPTEVLPA